MRKGQIYSIIAFWVILACVSCQQPSFYDDDDSSTDGTGSSDGVAHGTTITVNVATDDYLEFVSSKAADEGTYYTAYLFAPDGSCVHALRNSVAKGLTLSFDDELKTGKYTICSLVGHTKDETVASTELTLTSLATLPQTLHNLYLGDTSFTVDENTDDYSVTVTATRLMAQLSVSILNVPSTVSAVSIVLPSQASQFTMSGSVQGTGTSQTIDLVKGEQSASGTGTYTWKAENQLIYPSADGCTSMPLKVVVTYNDNTTKTIESVYNETVEGKYCCTRGTSTTLTSRFSTPVATGITLDESFSEATGTFNLGN